MTIPLRLLRVFVNLLRTSLLQLEWQNIGDKEIRLHSHTGG
jgi:hypothetical protein